MDSVTQVLKDHPFFVCAHKAILVQTVNRVSQIRLGNCQLHSCRYFSSAVRFMVPPTITSPPKPVYQKIYTPVNLTCLASGFPTPHIQWFKDGSQLSERVLPYLYIPELEVQDRGYYHCSATAVYVDGSSDTVQSQQVVVNIQGLLLAIELIKHKCSSIC